MHTAQREAAERDREIDTACRAAGIRVRGDSKPILDTLVETVEGQAVAALRIPKRMYVFGTCLRSKFQVMQRTRCALSHTVLHGAGRSHSADPSLIKVEKVCSYGVGVNFHLPRAPPQRLRHNTEGCRFQKLYKDAEEAVKEVRLRLLKFVHRRWPRSVTWKTQYKRSRGHLT